MRILAVLGIEVMACVTNLDRITRRPPAPARGARLHTGREAPKSSKYNGNASWAAYGALAPRTGRAIAEANRAGKANA